MKSFRPPFTASDPMKVYNIILRGFDQIDVPRHVSRWAVRSIIISPVTLVFLIPGLLSLSCSDSAKRIPLKELVTKKTVCGISRNTDGFK